MRGISPIVATVLLIAIVVAIGALLYMGVAQMIEQSSTQRGEIYTVMFDAYKESAPSGAYGVYFHYYIPVSTPMNWVDAFNYCKERGMFLATPTNKPQLDTLIKILEDKGWYNAYVGVYQEPDATEPDGGWKYISGDPVTSPILWADSQPDDANGQDVSRVGIFSPTNKGLDDIGGVLLFPSICEKVRIGFTVTNQSDSAIRLQPVIVTVYDHQNNLLATKKVGEVYNFSVDISGTVYSFSLPAFKCDTYEVPPRGSASCSFWGVSLRTQGGFEPYILKVCLTGEGLKVCDTLDFYRG